MSLMVLNGIVQYFILLHGHVLSSKVFMNVNRTENASNVVLLNVSCFLARSAKVSNGCVL